MNQRFEQTCGAYVLQCAPLIGAHGKFTARLLAWRADSETVVPLEPSAPFDNPDEAAEYALVSGLQWVREHQ